MFIKLYVLSISLMASSTLLYQAYPIVEGLGATQEDVNNFDLSVFHRMQKDMDKLAEIQGIEPFDLQLNEIEKIKKSESIEDVMDIYNNIMTNFGEKDNYIENNLN